VRHSSKGLSPRACHAANRLANAIRVLVPSVLREPPLIVLMTTSGRLLRFVDHVYDDVHTYRGKGIIDAVDPYRGLPK